MPDPLPPMPTWLRSALLALVVLLAAGLLIFLVRFLVIFLYIALGARQLLWLAIAVFVVAWIAQFVGHKIEGRKPSFLTDLTYLLIGPAWVVAKAFRKFGWSW